MLGQVFTKLLTFIINQLLIRRVSSQVFGVTSFMELIYSCALFYSREGIRLTCQRIRDSSPDSIQSIYNFSSIPVLIGIPITLLLSTLLTDLSQYNYGSVSKTLLVASILIELVSEPFYNLNQHNLNFSVRTKIESISFILKCVAQFLLVYYLEPNDGHYILAFSISQLVYTFCISVLYYYSSSARFSISKAKSHFFQPHLLKYWYSLSLQLIFKYILTEGDRFILNYLCSTDEQGIFALINNYGSLIARLVFAPLEETLRMFLTQSTTNKKQVVSILSQIFKFYFYLSLMIVVFAPPNSSFFLMNFIGTKWTNSNDLLYDTFANYWYYIPFLAVNGILEATFHSITNDPVQINSYSKFMVICSMLYFVALFVLINYLQLSLNGLIMANILNMSMRIIYCINELRKTLSKVNLSVLHIVQGGNYLKSTALAAFAFILHSKVIGSKVLSLGDFIKSLALALLLLLGFMLVERELIKSTALSLFKQKKE